MPLEAAFGYVPVYKGPTPPIEEWQVKSFIKQMKSLEAGKIPPSTQKRMILTLPAPFAKLTVEYKPGEIATKMYGKENLGPTGFFSYTLSPQHAMSAGFMKDLKNRLAVRQDLPKPIHPRLPKPWEVNVFPDRAFHSFAYKLYGEENITCSITVLLEALYYLCLKHGENTHVNLRDHFLRIIGKCNAILQDFFLDVKSNFSHHNKYYLLLHEENAAPPRLTPANNEKSPLSLAILHDEVAIVRRLLQEGADPNQWLSSGESLLHNVVLSIACDLEPKKKLTILFLLLYYKADPNVKNSSLQTPAQFAMEYAYKITRDNKLEKQKSVYHHLLTTFKYLTTPHGLYADIAIHSTLEEHSLTQLMHAGDVTVTERQEASKCPPLIKDIRLTNLEDVIASGVITLNDDKRVLFKTVDPDTLKEEEKACLVKLFEKVPVKILSENITHANIIDERLTPTPGKNSRIIVDLLYQDGKIVGFAISEIMISAKNPKNIYYYMRLLAKDMDKQYAHLGGILKLIFEKRAFDEQAKNPNHRVLAIWRAVSAGGFSLSNSLPDTNLTNPSLAESLPPIAEEIMPEKMTDDHGILHSTVAFEEKIQEKQEKDETTEKKWPSASNISSNVFRLMRPKGRGMIMGFLASPENLAGLQQELSPVVSRANFARFFTQSYPASSVITPNTSRKAISKF